ncbi:MAG: hypothetical protein FJ125_13010, partial [Deltaproteobacteria bacterium]|nr:hypothetical protein [Deltaproteobacteria bacterium]
ALLALLLLALALPRLAAAEPPPPRPADEASWAARYRQPEDAEYRSPIGLALSPDGRHLYVSCERQNRVQEIDTASRKMTRSFPVGSFPYDVVPTRAGDRLYVSNRLSDDVSVVELATGREAGRLPAGDDPHGLALGPGEQLLYVANLAEDNVSVIDLASGQELRRLATGRAPFALARSPDGSLLYVSSQYSLPVPFRTPSVLELTTVDAAAGRVLDRRRLHSTVIGQGVAVSPDGHFAVVALELPKNLIPETQIYQGWMVTHGVAVAETRPGGKVAYLLLDEPNLYYADPFDVAFSGDGRRLFVTSSGVDTLTVLDWIQAQQLLRVQDGRIGLSEAEIERLSRNLAASNDYVVARVATGKNPKQVLASPEGRWLYVANRMGDTVGVVDTDSWLQVAEIDLGGPKQETLLRRGEVVFNYATISFQRQLSCNTCHPENLLDGLVYDIAADGGMGRNLVDNRTLRGIAGTEPFKWSGKNPTLERQEGPRAAQLFFRSHGFEPPDLEAISAFIRSIPLAPNRYRRAELNEFQLRGKRLFERAYTNDGRYIPLANRCITCHEAPFYTDRLKHDVGSQQAFDDLREYDTPQLNNIYEQAPYLHDGRVYSLEEIWTKFNLFDEHGVTNDMTKEQLNDLIEYLKTL